MSAPDVREAPVMGVYDTRAQAERDRDLPKATPPPELAGRVDWSRAPGPQDCLGLLRALRGSHFQTRTSALQPRPALGLMTGCKFA